MNGAEGLHVYLKSHRNQHSIVKQLSSKNKNKLKKKESPLLTSRGKKSTLCKSKTLTNRKNVNRIFFYLGKRQKHNIARCYKNTEYTLKTRGK